MWGNGNRKAQTYACEFTWMQKNVFNTGLALPYKQLSSW